MSIVSKPTCLPYYLPGFDLCLGFWDHSVVTQYRAVINIITLPKTNNVSFCIDAKQMCFICCLPGCVLTFEMFWKVYVVTQYLLIKFVSFFPPQSICGVSRMRISPHQSSPGLPVWWTTRQGVFWMSGCQLKAIYIPFLNQNMFFK